MKVESPLRSVLLDSSPLLLWLAGRTDPRIISRFKHLAMFQLDDYELLDRVLQGFRFIVTTPHVLTEVSNHAQHLKGPSGEALIEALAEFASSAPERFTLSSSLGRREEFKRFGLTDCDLWDASSEVTLLTTDFRLAGYLEAEGKRVINLNHLRQSRLLR